MTAQPAGWYPNDAHPFDHRWWDGTQWANAYWPHSRPNPAYLPGAQRWDISTSGEPRFDVVGENWHEAAIANALGGKPALNQEVEAYVTAELVPEPDNPHDPNAICVRIDGRTVGYLDSAAARSYTPLVHRLVRARIVPTVRARIWAVTRYVQARNRPELKSAIRLALPEPSSVLPVNAAPNSPHAVVPRGRKVQVTGESEHYEAIAPFVGTNGPVLTTLHTIDVVKARSTTQVVEVRIDDNRVGQLTAATSASLLPLIDEAARQGLITAAWGSVTGSRLAAEVAVHVAKAEEVLDTWPSREDTVPPLMEMQQVPRAYVSTDPIEPPPAGAGIGTGWWVLAVVVALLLCGIPYVGWLLGIGALAGLFILHRQSKRKAPSSANRAPATHEPPRGG